ncbi:MAG: TetR/AcrR family transcriptional regulator [Blautia sp.]|nr:TetR/AcrR family transcriptional regulator [Blautia sp.]MCM1201265.1 TetR/AcrR family transcriptional regulator [Bacteroides fragilis]
MPKCYSDNEKTEIRVKLREEAKRCMSQYGIRRTTVDELVNSVGIPKGTFYLFYQSKEELLYEALSDEQGQMEQELRLFAKAAADKPTEVISEMLFALMKKFAQKPLFALLQSEEMELLTKKLPEKVIYSHLQRSNSMFEEVFRPLKSNPNADLMVFGAAMHSVFISMIYECRISENIENRFDESCHMLLYGLLLQIR